MKKKSITDRVKGYMKNVTIDVFGYEKTVNKNIIMFSNQIAKKHNLNANHINIRINQHNGLFAHVFGGKKFLETLTATQLIEFFMGHEATTSFDLKQQIEKKVNNYLSNYANCKRINKSLLVINISCPKEVIKVASYYNSTLIELIPLKDLIKHFKP